MSEHTPGPWTCSAPWSGFAEVTGPDGNLVFGIAAGSIAEKRPDAECEANARMIAAAPEMYGLLLDTLELIEDGIASREEINWADLSDRIATVIAKTRPR